MANIRFKDIRDYRDLMTINYYNRLKREGGDLRGFLAAQAEVSRDNGRTPMQEQRQQRRLHRRGRTQLQHRGWPHRAAPGLRSR